MPRTAAPFLAILGLQFFLSGGAAESAEPAISGGIFGDLLPLAAGDLDSLSGGPLVFTKVHTSGDGRATANAAIGGEGHVTASSSIAMNGSVAGAPITMSNAAISTGGFGDVVMENSAGISAVQLSTGLGNVQQTAVSFMFVMSGLPQ